MKIKDKIIFLILGLVIGILVSSFVYLYFNYKQQIENPIVNHSVEDHLNMAKALTNYTDLDFLNMMIIHHNDAIEMADIALRNSTNSFILFISKNIISSQNQEISQMKTEMEKIVNTKQ